MWIPLCVAGIAIKEKSEDVMVNEFKVGDKVAHEELNNGTVDEVKYPAPFGLTHLVKFDFGQTYWVNPKNLRPRNFLSKIADDVEKTSETPFQRAEAPCWTGPEKPKTVDQQFNEVFKDAVAHGTGFMKDGKHVPHNEIFNTDRFQRNAYGQLVDTVTGLEADSDGLVKISSIRDSVREIS